MMALLAPRHRPRLGLLAIGLLILALSWWADLRHLVQLVSTRDVFSHGMVIPFISLWLIWRMRGELSALAPAWSVSGAIALLGATVLWFAGGFMDAGLPGHIAIVSAVNALVLMMFGLHLYRRILFPMLFLYLMVPFGYGLIPPLQTLTAQLTIGMLGFTTIPHTVEGVLITLPSGHYEVAQACSGIKFLFTSLVTSVLMAHLAFHSWRRRAAMVLAGLLVPVLANALRVFGILILAEFSDQSFARGIDHIVYGWGFLSVILLILITGAYRFSDHGKMAAPAPAVVATGKPLSGAAGAFVILACAAPVAARAVLPPIDPAAVCAVPPAIAPVCDGCDYRQLDTGFVRDWPRYEGADQDIRALYRNGGFRLQFYMGLYSPARPGHQIRPGAQLALTGDWKLLPGIGRGVFRQDGQMWREAVYWQHDARKLVWELLLTDGKPVLPGWSAKLASGLSRLRQGVALQGGVTLVADLNDDLDTVRAEFDNFLSTFPPDTFLWAQLVRASGEELCAASRE